MFHTSFCQQHQGSCVSKKRSPRLYVTDRSLPIFTSHLLYYSYTQSLPFGNTHLFKYSNMPSSPGLRYTCTPVPTDCKNLSPGLRETVSSSVKSQIKPSHKSLLQPCNLKQHLPRTYHYLKLPCSFMCHLVHSLLPSISPNKEI